MQSIILHGTKGSPDGNWFPWLASELKELGIKTYVPKLPTPENQSLETWHSAFKSASPALDPKTILIGHSTGALFAMRLLEEIDISITCTVLVAPPFGEIGISEYDRLNATFFKTSFDWHKVKANAGKLLYLMGDNDPYVPQKLLQETAKNIDVKPIVIKNGRHLNSEAGYNSFPVLLDLLKGTLE